MHGFTYEFQAMLSANFCFCPNFLTFKEPKNRFQGTNSARLCSLVRQLYSYSVPSPHRLFKNFSTDQTLSRHFPVGRSYFSGFISDILRLKEFSHHFICASKSLLILTEKQSSYKCTQNPTTHCTQCTKCKPLPDDADPDGQGRLVSSKLIKKI